MKSFLTYFVVPIGAAGFIIAGGNWVFALVLGAALDVIVVFVMSSVRKKLS